MGPQMSPDGALGGGRLSVGDVGGWLNSYAFHAESAFCWGRDVAATMRDAVLRRVSGCGRASDTCIRHERQLVADARDRLRQTSGGALTAL